MIQSLYKVEDYSQEKLNTIVQKIMIDQGVLKDLSPTSKVVIKPNLILAKSPTSGAITHPNIVRAVAIFLQNNGIKDITLAESSGGPYFSEYMKNVYKASKMSELSDVLKLNNDFSSKPQNCPQGFKNHSFNIISPIVNADYIINIAKLKTHSMTGMSGGIKNLFGVIPGLEKPQLHYLWPNKDDFANMLLELSQIVKPDLTIIDAIDAMEGNGPTGGTIKHLGLLLGAKDFYTQDYYACNLMQLEPCKIPMINLAMQKGFVQKDQIILKGDSVPKDLKQFKIPDSISLDLSNVLPGVFGKFLAKIIGKILKSYPKLDKTKCIGCAKCAESCPQKIIKIVNKKAVFPKKNCISCFCCQEMCPVKAIFVKRAL